MNKTVYFRKISFGVLLGIVLAGQAFAADEDLRILRQGALGAGVGAVSSYASGGKAGKGALIGAGTAVIGNAVLGILTESPRQQVQQVQRVQQVQMVQPVYYSQPVMVQERTPRHKHRHHEHRPQTVYVYRAEPMYVYRASPRSC